LKETLCFLILDKDKEKLFVSFADYLLGYSLAPYVGYPPEACWAASWYLAHVAKVIFS
jgi:hypothetical protein